MWFTSCVRMSSCFCSYFKKKYTNGIEKGTNLGKHNSVDKISTDVSEKEKRVVDIRNGYEDDMHSLCSWRNKLNNGQSCTTLVVVKKANKLETILEISVDNSQDTTASPIHFFEEEMDEIPASPNTSFQQQIERSIVARLLRSKQGVLDLHQSQDFSPRDNEFRKFPALTTDEEECSRRQLLQKVEYLSSSSSFTSFEDQILHRPSVDHNYIENISGPIYWNDLDDDRITSIMAKRPEPDDGENPPTCNHRLVVSQYKHSGDGFIDEAIVNDGKSILIGVTPDLLSINNSAESEELDAMVAAIDHGKNDDDLSNSSSFVSIVNDRSDDSHSIMAIKSNGSNRSCCPIKITASCHNSLPIQGPSSYQSQTGTHKVQNDIELNQNKQRCLNSEEQNDCIRLQDFLGLSTTTHQCQSTQSQNRGCISNLKVGSPYYNVMDDKYSNTNKGVLEGPYANYDNTNRPNNIHSSFLIPLDVSPMPTITEQKKNLSGNDRLPDIRCEADPDLKERYRKACWILKMSLFEKKSKLQELEKLFLSQLIIEASSNDEFLTEEKVVHYELNAKNAQSNQLLDDTISCASVISNDFSNATIGRQTLYNAEYQCNTYDMKVSANNVSRSNSLTENDLHRHNQNNENNNNILDQKPISTMSHTSSSLFSQVDDDYPYTVFGMENGCRPKVLAPCMMYALRAFVPYNLCQSNYCLQYAHYHNKIDNDEPNLAILLSKIQNCTNTFICVETNDGYVFGAFCSSPWIVQSSWYGSNEAFLWRLKNPRCPFINNGSTAINSDHKNDIEIYPYTGVDTCIQYCSQQAIAVGGGTDWSITNKGSPYTNEPSGIGFLLDGDLMGGETNSCVTFANPRLGNQLRNDSNEFDVKNLEIWTMKPCL